MAHHIMKTGSLKRATLLPKINNTLTKFNNN